MLGSYCRILQRFMVALLNTYFLNVLLEPISFAWTRHLYRNEEALWPSSHRTSVSIKLCRDNRWQKEADAPVWGRGGVQCPHPTLRQREGERDGAMKMTDGSTNGRAVNGGKGEEGGAKVDEGQHWQLSRPTCPPIPSFPSWFASPRWDTCRRRPGKQEQVS